jgi:spermidine synthase
MTEFPNMAEIVPEGTIGVASVRHKFLDGTAASRACYAAGQYIATPPGKYAFLYVEDKIASRVCMMSDLSYERDTCLDVVRHAHGNVLIAGLGLGMILHPILKNPEVTSVTVIEKYQDVIDLILPALLPNEKLSVIQADIFCWVPPQGVSYDVIWFDIWPDILPQRLAEMKLLHERFAICLNRDNPRHWMNSWHHDETLAHTASHDSAQ